MAYVYKFIPAGDPIQNPPKQTMKDSFQATLNDKFYESYDWYTIQEETSFASGEYQSVDVRVNSLINPTTGDNVEDDYKKLLFKNINHPVNLGKIYSFDNNLWITINVDKIKTLTSTVTIKRCNNTLRWIDEISGALYTVPCSLGYLINENRDYATAGSATVTPSGMIPCIVQFNSKSNTIKPNQRFLLGNSENWTAYRVEGGGINNFNNLNTSDNNSAGFIRLSLSVDYSGTNTGTDDLVNGIANVTDNLYVLSLNESSIVGNATQQIQIEATLTLNGQSVTRNLIWSSGNTLVATVNSSGLVTFVSEGSTTITCQLENNSTISDICSVTVETSPTDTYQIIFSPNKNYVYESQERTWSVYLYKNTVQQADAIVFTMDSNTVPADHFIYSVLDDNSFKIQNFERFLTDELEVTATSGSYSIIIPIALRGAW